jgi:2-C-methyl-D-erythritol 2,4-cyclodiphosphate synthase
MSFSTTPPARVGLGEDAHRLIAGRALILAGVAVPDAPRGALAHSDGDAVLHAVADALLAALALGDIGHYFPDTAASNHNLNSAIIIADALARVTAAGFGVVNLACVVTLDRPKLGPLRTTMQHKLAELLNIPTERVGLSFKTSEGLAPDHVQTRAVVLLEAQ